MICRKFTPKVMRALVAVVMLVPFGLATAGEVRGTVHFEQAPKGAEAVVYLVGDSGLKVPPEKPTLSQASAQFSPSLLVVSTGQTVVMPNDDHIAHNVFSFSPAKKFNLGLYPKGEVREVQFDTPGRVDLYCSIHRHMHAIVLVVDSVIFQKVAVGTSFSLKEVPAGTYTLTVWIDGAAEYTNKVEVPKDGALTVDATLEQVNAADVVE